MDDKSSSEKTMGYILLLTGLAVIIFAGFSVYSTFTGLMKPFELFNFEAIKIDIGKFIIQGPGEAPVTQDIVPAEVLNSPMNYFAHLLLMGFVASIGLKISTIGTTLLRPIKVKVSEQKKSVLEPINQ